MSRSTAPTFGGSIRQENYKADRKDRRLAEHPTGKRRVVVVMRERQGRSLPFVVRAEDEGVATVARRGRWCMEAGEVRVLLTPSPSGDTNRDRLGSPDHTVEHLDGDSSLTLLTSERVGTQPRADGRFIAADSGFRQTAATVAGGLLPSHSSLVADVSNVPVALGRRPVGLVAGHRRRARRYGDGGRLLWLLVRNRLVSRRAVVGSCMLMLLFLYAMVEAQAVGPAGPEVAEASDGRLGIGE